MFRVLVIPGEVRHQRRYFKGHLILGRDKAYRRGIHQADVVIPGIHLDARAERQCGDALGFLRSLVASKVAETLLLWCIGDLFRQALKSSGQAGYGGSWGRQSNPFATWEIAPVARRRYSQQELLQALTLVHQADLGIKSSWKDSTLLLEFLIWRITVAPGMAGRANR